MLDTYFLIEIEVDDNKSVLGPYLGLDYATVILVDHAPIIAKKLATKNKYTYRAKIKECILMKTGIWETISTPIKETNCIKRKRI